MEDKVDKNSQKEQRKEKRLKKNKEVLREVQGTVKCSNIIIIGIPEGEEQGIETCLKNNDGEEDGGEVGGSGA